MSMLDKLRAELTVDPLGRTSAHASMADAVGLMV